MSNEQRVSAEERAQGLAGPEARRVVEYQGDLGTSWIDDHGEVSWSSHLSPPSRLSRGATLLRCPARRWRPTGSLRARARRWVWHVVLRYEGETCDACGGRVTVAWWEDDSDRYAAVYMSLLGYEPAIRGVEPRGGLLCLKCYNAAI